VTRLDSALGRPILWNYASNRFAVIASAVGAVILAITRLVGDRPVTIGNVVGSFGALFLAWAVARELDPDENLSAGVALLLAFVALLQFGFASLWLVGGVLLGTRLIVGTVGVSVRWGDVGVLTVLAAYLGYRHASWIVIAAVTVGAVVSGGRRRAVVGLPVAIGGVLGLVVSDVPAGLGLPSGATLVALVGVVASVVILWSGPAPVSTTDLHSRSIDRHRLLAGRVASGLSVTVVSLQTGFFAALSPVAAALLGAAVVRLVQLTQAELSE